MSEDAQKNQSLSDETGLWFENRGLFSDHFLKAQLPQWKEWETGAMITLVFPARP
jgi:hypothetical protein